MYQALTFSEEYKREYRTNLKDGDYLSDVQRCVFLSNANAQLEPRVHNGCDFSVEMYTCDSGGCERRGKIYQLGSKPLSEIEKWEAWGKSIWCEEGRKAIAEGRYPQCIVSGRRY